jgi:hypothetical protein
VNDEGPPAATGLARACGAGEFILFFRNRPVGRESARAAPTPGGGLRLKAETALQVGRARLRQEVVAEFDGGLRPESCIVTADFNSRQMRLEIEFDRMRAAARYLCDGREEARPITLDHPPLLLVDNCFSLHALAVLAAAGREAGEVIFTSVPASLDLTVTAPGERPVVLGGTDFGPPALTLHLAPDLQEHAWIHDGRVERLVVPQMQMRVDWITEEEREGGPS